MKTRKPIKTGDTKRQLTTAFKGLGMSEAGAALAAQGRDPVAVREVVKNVAGLDATAFAWCPDPGDPLSWRLQIARSSDTGDGAWLPDAELVKAAVQMLPGIGSFDRVVEIPENDLPGVKSVLRSAWIASGCDVGKMPAALNEAALRSTFEGLGLTPDAAKIAARGRA